MKSHNFKVGQKVTPKNDISPIVVRNTGCSDFKKGEILVISEIVEGVGLNFANKKTGINPFGFRYLAFDPNEFEPLVEDYISISSEIASEFKEVKETSDCPIKELVN